MRFRPAVAAFAGALVLSAVVAGIAAGQGTARPASGNAGARALMIPHDTWSCGLPSGIPAPETGTLLFTVEAPLERVAEIGLTQYGQRQVAVTQQGTIAGPRLSGTVMTGGLDYTLTIGNGVVEIEQIFVFRTADGRYIYARTCGTGPDAKDVRVVLDMEAPNGSDAAWLNSGTYVARRLLDPSAKTMTLRVYEVSAPAPAASADSAIRISKPAGVPAQPWDYRRAETGEKQGAQLIVERVALAPSQTVGASKRGNRNIIPITGGEVSGRINGKVLPGGADYQNAGIDARYLWETSDGEIIIVRNGGQGRLVPTFEVRVGSPYAFLNNGLYLSSPPGMGKGGVTITFYEVAK
jgi:hypothetical protein